MKHPKGSSRPKVFVSYHDTSKSHSELVLATATRLRNDGIRVYIDSHSAAGGEGLDELFARVTNDPTLTAVLIFSNNAYAVQADAQFEELRSAAKAPLRSLFDDLQSASRMPLRPLFERAIVAICERTATGESRIPRYLTGCVQVDYSSAQVQKDSYETLLRSIFDKAQRVRALAEESQVRGRAPINEVFTPRSADVNSEMYVPRPHLEISLSRILDGTTHALIYGDSGSGKTWLYKQVLKDRGAKEFVANCANAARLGSLTNEIVNVSLEPGRLELTGMEETKSAKASAFFAEGALESKRQYRASTTEPLLAAYQRIAEANSDGPSVLVFDNLESIFRDPKLMDELANIITVTDDRRYAQYGVRLIIVGVPSEAVEYFTRTKNLPTIANRITELPRVANLSEVQVLSLLKKGFQEKLMLQVSAAHLNVWRNHIMRVTFGIPQRVHEFCEQLAFAIEDQGWSLEGDLLKQADSNWLQTGLARSYATITAQMNERDSAIGRRNQVLYALGHVESDRFTSSKIEEFVRRFFPTSTSGKNLGIASILKELSRCEDQIIKEAPKIGEYEFAEPRHRIALRLTLAKDRQSERVIKLGF